MPDAFSQRLAGWGYARSPMVQSYHNSPYSEETGPLRQSGLPLYLITAVLAAVAALPWSWELACRQNRPVDHPLWTWTKAHHRVMPVGSRPMLTGSQNFAGNRANLHAWHGDQEMVLLRPCDPSELSFRAKLSPRAALVVFLDRTRPIPHPDDPPRLAVRLSSDPQTPSAWLMVDGEGRFTEKQVFFLKSDLTERRWTPFLLHFSEEGITLYQNDTPVSTTSRTLSGTRHLAFRGSFAGYFCAVDDISILDRAGNLVLSESFDRRDLFFFSWPLCFLIFLLPGVGVLYLTRLWADWRTPVASVLILVQVTMLCTGTVFWYMATRQRIFYPRPNPMISNDRLFAQSLIQQRVQEVTEKHKFQESINRVICLGSSQTFGEGASDPDYAWVHRLEQHLRQSLSCPDLTVINLGIQGALSSHMADLYEQVAPICPHRLLCVNLGVNDYTNCTDFLQTSLERIIRSAESVGARVVVFSEAVSPNLYNYEHFQTYVEIIRATAERHGLPYMNLERTIGSDDDGLRWWDVVHPTDYGHRLIAEAVTPFLAALLEPCETNR